MEIAENRDAPIQVSDLTVMRGSTPVVRDVSFAVPAHRVCGLVGPAGAGKTTVLQALSGMVTPDEGTAHVLGRSYGGARGGVRDVTIALDGVDSRAIGRQLAASPRVAILDEPALAAADREAVELHAAVRDVARHGGAVLLAAAAMRDIADVVDDVVILRAGLVVVRSSIADLRASAARTGSVRVRTSDAARLGTALLASGRACLHLGRDLVRVHDSSEQEIRQIAEAADIRLDEVVVEAPDLDVVYTALVS